MRNLFFILLVFFLSNQIIANSSDVIGEETIEPVFYPKFFLIGDYSFGKKFHGFDDKTFRADLPNAWGTGLAFEAGLLKYFNAGAMLTFRIPLEFNDKAEPLLSRLLLFAKPFFAINNNLAVFSRIGTGIVASTFNTEASYAANQQGNEIDYMKPYNTKYIFNNSFGLSGTASLGIEYFPFSRIGLAVEGGIRTDVHWSKGVSGSKKSLNEDKNNAPEGLTTMSFMTYDFPLSINLIFII